MIDKNTGKAVPYANIWVEKERVGVSADSDGNFFIDRKDLIGKTLIVTSVAYERKTVVITSDILKIELIPVVYLISKRKMPTLAGLVHPGL